MKAAAKPADASWLWTLAYGQHEDRTPTHGYEATREAAMAAFARSWRREWPGAGPAGAANRSRRCRGSRATRRRRSIPSSPPVAAGAFI
jgi:hypothetical protein